MTANQERVLLFYDDLNACVFKNKSILYGIKNCCTIAIFVLLGYIFPISCISLTLCVTGSRVSGQHSLDPDGITGPLGCDWCRKGKYDLHAWASRLTQLFSSSISIFFVIPISYLSSRYCNWFELHWRFLCGTTGVKGLKMPSSTLELWWEVVLSFN